MPKDIGFYAAVFYSGKVIFMKKRIIRLAVSAVMTALASVLSLIKVAVLPMGGAVTLLSMLPICLLSFLYGPLWGIFCGAMYGTLQLLLDVGVFSFVTWWGAAAAVILLDYIAAFGCIGLSGVFCRGGKMSYIRTASGTALACALRFLCHFLSGVTVWRELAGMDAVWYSFLYNETYMLPELVLTSVAVVLLLRTGAMAKIKEICK